MFTIKDENYELEKYTFKLEYTTERLDKPFRNVFSNKWIIDLIVVVKDTDGLILEYVYNAISDRYLPIDRPLSCEITNSMTKDYKQFIIDDIVYKLSYINLVTVPNDFIQE